MSEACVFDHPIVIWANVFALLACWGVLGLIICNPNPNGAGPKIVVAGAAALATIVTVFTTA